MGKYFVFAFVFALLAMGIRPHENSPAVGFAVSAGLCILAAAVERGAKSKE